MSAKISEISSVDSKFYLNPRLELVAVLILLSLVMLLRLHHLDADPPVGLSSSTDVYTDPSQYTIFARNFIQTDDFDPFDDNRRIVFLKSSVTALAVAVFGTLGIGVWQSNFVGFLYALGALLLFYLFIRKVGGAVAGLLFLLLAGLNYNLLFYGRLPFLEHSMAFFAFLALVLVIYFRRAYVWLLAGISLGISIFFGKAIGLVFLFPFAVFFVYQFLWGYSSSPFDSAQDDGNNYAQDDGSNYDDTIGEGKSTISEKSLGHRGTVIRRLIPYLLFAAGLGATAVFWYFFVYAPMQNQVTSYFGEQALSLYGYPDGLKSPSQFFERLVTFGKDSKLFTRMWSEALLAAVFIGVIFYGMFRRWFHRNGSSYFNGGHLFLVAMIVGFYGSLMIWNYRPLRYQLVMIYAIYGAAAIVLTKLWQLKRDVKTSITLPLFYSFCLLLILVPIYKILDKLGHRHGWSVNLESHRFLTVLAALVIIVSIGLLIRYKPWGNVFGFTLQKRVLVILLVITSVGLNTAMYIYWAQRPTFTLRDNSRDLGLILNRKAVVSGPFGPAMAMGNNFNCIIHMFGVSQANPELFHKFPITHLLLDDSNEEYAQTDYPDLMDSATHVFTYHIWSENIRLFRIAGHTGNSEADSYRLSKIEKAIDLYHQDKIKDGHRLAAKFLEQNQHNLSGYLAVGTVAEEEKDNLLAERCYKKAIEFSPTNYHLNSKLAELYKKQFVGSADELYKQKGLRFYEEAMRLAPKVPKMRAAYRELKDNEAWQLKEKIDSLSQP
ncbi:MAG: hypothetical protein U9N55_02180 [candidate division Zixibacteria bacterium]|nr:hypothetical protein [candidate division Zixibacteria bacterium]